MLKSAFTLLELLIVITIVAILAGAIVPLFQTNRLEAQIAKAKQDLEAMTFAGRRAYNDVGFVPAHIYLVFPDDPFGNRPAWRGPYIDKLTPDPWGNNYSTVGFARSDIMKIDIYYMSYGPDGQQNACQPDDICVIVGQNPN